MSPPVASIADGAPAAGLAHRPPERLARSRLGRSAAAAGAYIALTKPRIIELLLVTTVPAMFLAQGGVPSLRLVAATVVGGTLAAGGANTLNCYVDRDIDALMTRTAHRPLVRKQIPASHALVFGILLSIGATALLALLVNRVAAALAAAAILFYVFVYTLGLKRRTASNIVIGGAAGCFPVLVGWAAVTGTVELPALLLFLVVFFWTPPHFWALAMKFEGDYASAGVPMLPNLVPPAVVARKILGYSYAMVAVTLALAPYAGWSYSVAAVLLGVTFLVEAHRLSRRVRSNAAPRSIRLFHLSITYLTLLFTAVALSGPLP